MNETTSRRELSTRKISFFHKLAKTLVQKKLTPNQVSVASAAFGILSGACFGWAACLEGSQRAITLFEGSVFIQLRLLCNMIDGLMAVEHGKKTASGEIFNDVPDRVSDVAIIFGAGYFAQLYAPWMLHVGWAAALAAVMTAYIRMLGSSMSGVQDFSGPMAKQHRMFLLTVGGLGSIIEAFMGGTAYVMSIVLMIVLIGSIITCVRRLSRLYTRLEKK